MKTKHKKFGQPFALALGMIGTLTIASAKRQLAALGMTLTHRDGEYKVNYPNAPKGTGYFTNDLKDALMTGIDMAGQRDTIKNAIAFDKPKTEQLLTTTEQLIADYQDGLITWDEFKAKRDKLVIQLDVQIDKLDDIH